MLAVTDEEGDLSWVEREDVQAIIARGNTPWGVEAFERQVANGNNCAHPVRLAGTVSSYDAHTGEKTASFDSAELPDGVLLKACGNRRATRCPPCSRVYKEDARHLVTAGLVGGKGVPESVAGRPCVFATITGPSFGAVHSVGKSGPRPCRPGPPQHRCPHGRSLACFERHAHCDRIVGEALCADCYRYEEHIVWNSLANELWRRTTVYLSRSLAKLSGLTAAELAKLVRIETVRVSEFQERGVVHFHFIARADGPDGAGSAPPAWLSGDLLAVAVRLAVGAVSVPYPVRLGHRVAPKARWGEMLDVSVISAASTAKKMASYTTKYLVKGTDEAGVLDRRVRYGDIELLSEKGLPAHQCRLVETAWRLGGRSELAHLHIRDWTHQLGYRGNCIGRSRGFSTTLGALRRARMEHTRRKLSGAAETSNQVRIAEWRWCGTGYLTKGDALLARNWAERAAEGRFLAWMDHDERMWDLEQAGWPDVEEWVTVDADKHLVPEVA
jgi:hypothetical protein